ncbi:MAG: pyridoxamine 5'-phosphate oxidase family protein [Dehalococcoidia bacterium]
MTPNTGPSVRSEPHRDRPVMSEGYGLPAEIDPERALTWQWVTEQIAASRNYWVASTRPDGRPHVMPVWGLWLDDAFLFSTDPRSRKGRNIAARPEIVVHLESGDDVVILDGRAEPASDSALLARYTDAYEVKYAFRPDPTDPNGIVYALRPATALAWREQDFVTTAVRYRFT